MSIRRFLIPPPRSCPVGQGHTVGFGDKIVLDKLNLDIYRGEILGFVGASGAGKSVLMRTVLRLLPRRAGTIEILGAITMRSAMSSAWRSIRGWGCFSSTAPYFQP